MAGRLSLSGTRVGLPCGFSIYADRSSSKRDLPRSFCMAVMPRSFFSYGSYPASVTALATDVSSVYLRTDRPSTSLKPCHSFPERACWSAYSLMSDAHETRSSTLERMISISASDSSGRSLKSCWASFRFSSALARQTFFALQNRHQSPQENSPLPSHARSAAGFRISSAQVRRSAFVRCRRCHRKDPRLRVRSI